MEQLLELLKEIKPDVDFSTATDLVSSHILDSFDIVNLIFELKDTFDIDIPAEEIVPDNFNSVNAIWDMVQRMEEDM